MAYQTKLLGTSPVTTLAAIRFSADGTQLYCIDSSDATISQYALSTAWDITTAASASKSLDVSGQDSSPWGLAFSSDGTKLYIVGTGSIGTVYQYALSTAWDISTGSYASKSLSTAAQDEGLRGVALSGDGSKLYVVGDFGAVFQYTLGTAWDISTGSYASKSLTVSGQDYAPMDVVLSGDGSKLYIIGNGNAVFQYTLSTAWDISTGSYASKTKDVSGDIISSIGLHFSSTGGFLYAGCGYDNEVHQYALSTAWDVSTAGDTPAATTGNADAPISIDVQIYLEMIARRAFAPISIDVQAGGTASAAVSVSVVNPTGTASAPISIDVQGQGAATAAISVGVVTSLATAAWSARVVLDGTDVSSRVGSIIEVDAEEGAARVASFVLVPDSGVVQPIAWTGRTVSIDLLRGGVPSRLFTGRVDVAEFDPVAGLVRFACTDDLQNRVAALTQDEVDALCGGTWSASVFGDINDRWRYAQERMETRAASLDAGPHGGLRVTNWHGLTAWATYTDSDVLDASPRIELPRRAELTNAVEAVFQYRYFRLRERRHSVAYSQSRFSADTLAIGAQYPTREAIEAAVEGTGWLPVLQVFAPAPARIDYGEGYLLTNTGAIANYYGVLAQRYAQPVTETQSMRIEATSSIAANGEIVRNLRGALASEWDPTNWESSLTETPDAYPDEADHAPDAPRTDAEAGMQVLLDMAETRIYASHRKARVGFTLLCRPELDLDRALRLETDHVTAEGKVYRLRHRLDTWRGSATTEVTLALSGVAAAGLLTPDTLAPPAAADVDVGDDSYALPDLGFYTPRNATYDDDLLGWLQNTTETLTLYGLVDENGEEFSKTVDNPWHTTTEFPVTGFRARSPAVDSVRRDPLEVSRSSTFVVEIPEDDFTLTA